MPDLPTRVDYYQLGRDFLVQRAKKINPAEVDVAGSNANIFVGSASVLAAEVTKQLGYQVNRLLLDGAEGEDLDRLAWDRYQLLRKGASAALGSVVFTRASVATGLGSIQIGTVIKSKTGIEYVTTTVANFGASDLTSTADVRASQAGKASQVGANSLQKFKALGSLFDQTLTVNNPDPTAGGEDIEDDDAFKGRIRDFWRTARRGILAAIEFGATSVPGVASAKAIEVVTAIGGTSIKARVVLLYIADSSGVASEALAQKVRVSLDDFAGAGIAVLVATSIPQIVSIMLRLSFAASVDTVALTQAVLAAVQDFVNSLPVNEPLRLSELGAVLVRFKPNGLLAPQNAIVAPTGDLTPSPGSTLRTDPAHVTLAAA